MEAEKLRKIISYQETDFEYESSQMRELWLICNYAWVSTGIGPCISLEKETDTYQPYWQL